MSAGQLVDVLQSLAIIEVTLDEETKALLRQFHDDVERLQPREHAVNIAQVDTDWYKRGGLTYFVGGDAE